MSEVRLNLTGDARSKSAEEESSQNLQILMAASAFGFTAKSWPVHRQWSTRLWREVVNELTEESGISYATCPIFGSHVRRKLRSKTLEARSSTEAQYTVQQAPGRTMVGSFLKPGLEGPFGRQAPAARTL